MRRIAIFLSIALAAIAPATAFDTEVQAVIDRMKSGKTMPIDAVGQLMIGAERWCYVQDSGRCMWADIYLEVSDDSATFELAHAWNQDYDVQFIDYGVFHEGRYICESGSDWLSSLRATSRDTGAPIGGRELAALKSEISANLNRTTTSCFDYIFEGDDPAGETVQLLQREFVDGVHVEGRDAEVTLHFDARTAGELTFY